ncbi:peptide/nickel transport system permease protein [Arthrobacter sp. CAN_A6]|uniref:ABC transporter permease n=1 Tax=Arthrobacter sp. CAN_A6 TaxID=2787721 RepID=UPI0018CB782B
MSIDLRPGTVPVVQIPPEIPAAATRNRVRSSRRRRRFRPGLILAVGFLAWLALAVAAPNVLASTDPYSVNPAESFRPPSAAHWFGTDESGADVYSRIVHGARTSLYIGVGATAIGLVGGTLLGLFAGLSKPFVEASVMRFLDVTLAVPEIILALVVIGIIGGGTENAILAIGAGSIAYYARITRTQAHLVRRAAYVEAAGVLGFPRWHVLLHHVLPNVVKPVLVLATIGVGSAIGAGASLSFLGLGTPPPAPEWGAMLSIGRNFISNAPWLITLPAAFLVGTVLAITVVGRELRRRSEGRTTS